MDKVKYLNDLRNIVVKIRVSGPITDKTLAQVKYALAKPLLYKPVALAVVVNSTGGSGVQSNLIRKEIQSFSQRHKIKSYCFAEDFAVSGAYLVLSSGNEVYSSSASLLGCIGSSAHLFEFKDLAEAYGVKRRAWSTSTKDLHTMLDPLSSLTEEAKDWVKLTLEHTKTQLENIVLENRGDKVVKDKAFNGEYFNAEEARAVGLVDFEGTCDDVMKRLYPQARIVEGKMGKFRRFLS